MDLWFSSKLLAYPKLLICNPKAYDIQCQIIKNRYNCSSESLKNKYVPPIRIFKKKKIKIPSLIFIASSSNSNFIES